MMGHILSQARGDFRILANTVFRKAEDLDRIVLPISFDQSKEAMRQNLETRKAALDYLDQGGAIGIFPGGTVSTGATVFASDGSGLARVHCAHDRQITGPRRSGVL